jgi:hypothetical protein
MNANQPPETDLPLLRYPFDQYQRYRDVRVAVDIIQSWQKDVPLHILDIGGTFTTLEFLSNYRVVAANRDIEDGIKLRCDGTKLPFENNSFDVVVTVDTLEHLPASQRQAFVDELLRVTASYAIITGPFANGYNELAEVTFNDFLVEGLGIEDRFLLEHQQNGLPNLDMCLQWVSKLAEHSITIPSGYLHHWLPLIAIRYYLNRFSNGLSISMDLDRLYNYKCYWSDHKSPSYRQVIVVSKKDSADILAEIKSAFIPSEEVPPPDLNGVIAMCQALRWLQILEERDNEIERLKKLVSGYESGRFIRFMSIIHRLKELMS